MADVDRFLARVVPWPTAALFGYVNIHWPGDKGWPGRAFQTHLQAVGFVNGMMRRPLDLFVCMSLQAQSYPPKLDARKREKRGATRSIAASVALKSFWLDVDTKDGKFKDTTHALTEFGLWRRKVGLPLPSLVLLTGSGGFHVHWVLDTPISVDVWRPVMAAIVNACQKEGFNADIGRSRAPDQVLRIPGTLNHKHNPPVAAKIVADNPDVTLAEIEQAMVPYKDTELRGRVTPQPVIVGKLGKPSAVFAGVPLPPRLDAGLDTYVPTIEDVAEECPFIDATLQLGGATHSEPLWRESLRVASFVQEGEEVAHDLSNQHPGYSERETDEKYANVLQYQKQYGWPQCQKIHDEGGVECRDCEHLPKGKSPLNFAKPLTKAVAAVATAAAVAIGVPPPTPLAAGTAEWLPTPYTHDKWRQVVRPVKVDKERTELQPIVPLPIYNFRDFKKNDEGTGQYMYAFDCAISPTELRSAVLTFSQTSDTRKLTDTLSDQGIPLLPEQANEMRRFMTAFTHQLREAKGRVSHECLPDGFVKKDGKHVGFAYGKQLHNGVLTVPIQPLRGFAGTSYEPTGSLDTWKDTVKLIIDQQRPELLAPLCASAGSPLMSMCGQIFGAVMHLYGPSGTGKSTSLRAAQSIWGSPSRMSQTSDTQISLDIKLGQLHHLPLLLDDVQIEMNRSLADFFKRIAQGQTRQRGARSGQDLQESHSFRSIIISSSNPSMQAHIAEFDTSNNAAMNRVLEYPVLPNSKRTGMLELGSEAARRFGLLDENFGVAGLALAKYYGANYQTCEKMVAQLSDLVWKRGNCGDEDRFNVALVALTMGGGLLLNKVLNLGIPEDALSGFLIEVLQDQSRLRKRSSNNLEGREGIENLFAEFIAASADRLVITKDIWTASSRPPAGWSASPVNVGNLRGGQIDVRVAINQRAVRISMPAFNAWLKRTKNMSVGQVRSKIEVLVPKSRISQWHLGHGIQGVEQARIWAIEVIDPAFYDFN